MGIRLCKHLCEGGQLTSPIFLGFLVRASSIRDLVAASVYESYKMGNNRLKVILCIGSVNNLWPSKYC